MIEQWTNRKPEDVSGPPEAAQPSSVPSDHAADEDPAIRIKEALEQMDHDRELFDEVLQTFLDTVPDLLRELQSSCQSSDWQAIKATAHSIRGAASNIAAESARAAAERLEATAECGDAQAIQQQVREIESHLERVQRFAATLGGSSAGPIGTDS